MEEKIIDKKEEKPVEKVKTEKKQKDKAIINANDLHMSTKQAKYICKFIKGKNLEESVYLMEQVIRKKVFVPMKGEIPHRTGGVIGRYPQKAAGLFIKVLKSLNANANVAGIDNPIITQAIANKASRPFRRFGSRKFKRTNVFLEVMNKK